MVSTQIRMSPIWLFMAHTRKCFFSKLLMFPKLWNWMERASPFSVYYGPWQRLPEEVQISLNVVLS